MIEDKAESIVAFQVRVARAKEAKPDDIAAVNRVAKAVIATLAACKNAVLKATLAEEAARLLKLPVQAIFEELGKVKSPSPGLRGEVHVPDTVEELEAEEYDPPMPGLDAQLIEPPSPAEMALMELLSANPDDEALILVLRELLPASVLSHDFTRKFVSSYLSACKSDFEKKLSPTEDKWYTEVLLEAELSNSSSQSVPKQMQDRARDIWVDHLLRLKAGESDPARQLDLSLKAKQIRGMTWPKFKEFAKGMQHE